MPPRPTFSLKRFFVSAGVGIAGAIGFVDLFVTSDDFLTRLGIGAAVVALVVAALFAPFIAAWGIYVWKVICLAPGVPDLLRAERSRTWLAVEANAALQAEEITMTNIREEGSELHVLLNVGSAQRVRASMQFEIVAVPDMDVYGVVEAEDVREQTTWCRLLADEGKAEFPDRLRKRVAEGDLVPPLGYAVRPFMAGAYTHTMDSIATASLDAIPSDYRIEEGSDGRDT